MRLINFLNEDRSRMISENDFMKELDSYSDIYEYYKKGGHLILRGASGESTYAKVQPSKSGERKSANTSNYYNLITIHDPSWKHIPPRSKSVIGSTSYKKSEGYNDTLYVILPKNGSLIAQADAEDFWNSFSHAFSGPYPLGNFNLLLTEIFETATGIKGYVPDNTLSELKDACKKVDRYLIDNDLTLEDITNDTYQPFRIVRPLTNIYRGSLYRSLLQIFDPKKANISVVKSGQPLRDGVECWTDGDCLMVEYSSVYNIGIHPND